jgi:hypothetical protein
MFSNLDVDSFSKARIALRFFSTDDHHVLELESNLIAEITIRFTGKRKYCTNTKPSFGSIP